jgi:hypothetical protein
MTTRSPRRAARKRVDLDQDTTEAPSVQALDPADRARISLLQRLIRLREATEVRWALPPRFWDADSRARE